MTQFDDVTKMTSYLIFLKIYCIIINLEDHKLAKSRNFGSPKPKTASAPLALPLVAPLTLSYLFHIC